MARKKFESSRERFKTLAVKRTNKVLNSLRVLSHCSNKSLYEYEPHEIDKIFSSIEEAVTEARSKFKEKKWPKFKL